MIPLNTSARLTSATPRSSIGPNTIDSRMATSSSVPASSGNAPTRLNARAMRVKSPSIMDV